MLPKTTTKLALKDVLRLIEEGKNAELCRDLDSLQKILQPVWTNIDETPDFQFYGEVVNAELLRLSGVFLSFYGNAHSLKNHQIRGKDLLTNAFEIFESNNLPDKAAEAKVMLAFCYWNAGEIEECESILEYVEAEFGKNLLHPVYLQICANRLLTLFWKQDYQAALKIIEDLKPAMEFCTDQRLQAMFHNQAGIFYRATKEYEKAIFHLTEAIRFAKRARNFLFVAINFNNLSFLYKELQDFDRAFDCISESIDNFTQINHKGYLSHAFDTKALIYLDQDKPQKALETINQAINYFYEGEDYRGLTDALWTRTRCELRIGRTEEALMTFAELETIAREKIGEIAVRKFAKNLSEEIYVLRRLPLHDEAAEFKKSRIRAALIETNGRISDAAKLLKLRNHQTLSDILKNQYPTLRAELGFQQRALRTSAKSAKSSKIGSRNVTLNSRDIFEEREIIRIVLSDKAFKFDFNLSPEKFETFYFDKHFMSIFGLDSDAVVAVVPIKIFKEGMPVLVTIEDVLTVCKTELDTYSNVYFITDEQGEWVPLDESNVIGEPIGYCPFAKTRRKFIEFSKLVK